MHAPPGEPDGPETAPVTELDDTLNADGPNSGEVIVTQNLWKTYEMGDQEVNALAASICASATTSTSPSWAPPAPASPP